MNQQSTGNIDVGSVFERVLSTYAQNWRVLMTGALILFAPIALLGGLTSASGSGGLAVIVLALLVLGSIWYQGMVVETVRDVQDGTLDASVGQLFRSVMPVIGTLFLAGILAAVGIVIGIVMLIAPGLFLLTIWSVVAPVIVIERIGVGASFSRSRELVRGNGWQVFGVIVAIFALQLTLSIVIGALSAIGDSVVWSGLLQLVQSLVVAPLWALAAAVLYFALCEAHGTPALAQPTGVLSGGFLPPVAPEKDPFGNPLPGVTPGPPLPGGEQGPVPPGWRPPGQQ